MSYYHHVPIFVNAKFCAGGISFHSSTIHMMNKKILSQYLDQAKKTAHL